MGPTEPYRVHRREGLRKITVMKPRMRLYMYIQAYADADKEDSRSRGLQACFQDKASVRLIRYSPVVAVP